MLNFVEFVIQKKKKTETNIQYENILDPDSLIVFQSGTSNLLSESIRKLCFSTLVSGVITKDSTEGTNRSRSRKSKKRNCVILFRGEVDWFPSIYKAQVDADPPKLQHLNKEINNVYEALADMELTYALMKLKYRDVLHPPRFADHQLLRFLYYNLEIMKYFFRLN